ncbi:unnamed protein product, partial [Iphiclides podalirius]
MRAPLGRIPFAKQPRRRGSVPASSKAVARITRRDIDRRRARHLARGPTAAAARNKRSDVTLFVSVSSTLYEVLIRSDCFDVELGPVEANKRLHSTAIRLPSQPSERTVGRPLSVGSRRAFLAVEKGFPLAAHHSLAHERRRSLNAAAASIHYPMEGGARAPRRVLYCPPARRYIARQLRKRRTAYSSSLPLVNKRAVSYAPRLPFFSLRHHGEALDTDLWKTTRAGRTRREGGTIARMPLRLNVRLQHQNFPYFGAKHVDSSAPGGGGAQLRSPHYAFVIVARYFQYFPPSHYSALTGLIRRETRP